MADYPRTAKLFKKWAEAMLNGAIVDKPNYSAQRANKGGPKARQRPRRRRRRSRIQRMRKKGE